MATYASQPTLPQGQPFGGQGGMTNTNRFSGMFGMGKGMYLGGAAQAARQNPNPLAQLNAPQQGMATAGGIQQAMQKAGNSPPEARSDWLSALIPYLVLSVKQAEVATGGNSSPTASNSSLGSGGGSGGGMTPAKPMGTPQNATGSQNQAGQAGMGGGLGMQGAMQGQLAAGGGQVGAYGVVQPGWGSLRPSAGPTAGVAPSIGGLAKTAMMPAGQPTPGLTANQPQPQPGMAPPPPGMPAMPPPNGGAPIPGAMGQPSIDPTTGQPLPPPQGGGGGAVDPATGQPMDPAAQQAPPPPATQVNPQTGMPSTSPMQDPPPLPLPSNPRMMPPRPAQASDHHAQGVTGGLMADKQQADTPMGMGDAAEDMQDQAMAMGSKTAWDKAATALRRAFSFGQPTGNGSSLMYPAMVGKTRVGTMGVQHHTLKDKVPQLSYSHLDPKFQGMGLGRKMYAEFLKKYGALGSDSVVSPEAQRVWQSMGKRTGNFYGPVATSPGVKGGGGEKMVNPTGGPVFSVTQAKQAADPKSGFEVPEPATDPKGFAARLAQELAEKAAMQFDPEAVPIGYERHPNGALREGLSSAEMPRAVNQGATTRTFVGKGSPLSTGPFLHQSSASTQTFARPTAKGLAGRIPGGRAGLLMGGAGLLGGFGLSRLLKQGSQDYDGKYDTNKSAVGESKGLKINMNSDHDSFGQKAWASISTYQRNHLKRRRPNPGMGKHAAEEKRGPEGEYCPECDARLERDPHSGTCNSCGHAWGTKAAAYSECTPFAKGFFEACDSQGLDLALSVEKVGSDFGEEAARELREGLEKVARAGGERAWQFGRGLLGYGAKPVPLPRVPAGASFGDATKLTREYSAARAAAGRAHGAGAAANKYIGTAAGAASPVARNAGVSAMGGIGGGLAGDDLGMGGGHTDVLGMQLNTRGMMAGAGAMNPALRRWAAKPGGYGRGGIDTAASGMRMASVGSFGGHMTDQALGAFGVNQQQAVDPATGQKVFNPDGTPVMDAGHTFGRLGAFAGLGAGAGTRGLSRVARTAGPQSMAHSAAKTFAGGQRGIQQFTQGTFDPIIGGAKAMVRKPVQWASGGTFKGPSWAQAGTRTPSAARVGGRMVAGAGLAATGVGMGRNYLQGEVDDMVQNAAAKTMNEALPALGEWGDQYMQERGMLNSEGQFDPTQAMNRGGGILGNVDSVFRSMGMDPSKMSPLQKVMVLGGAGAGAGGLLAGSPLMVGAGGTAAMAGLLPQLMPGQSQQQFFGPQAPYRPGQQAGVPGFGQQPNQPGARDEWLHQLTQQQHG